MLLRRIVLSIPGISLTFEGRGVPPRTVRAAQHVPRGDIAICAATHNEPQEISLSLVR